MKMIAGQPNPFGNIDLPPLVTRPSDYHEEEEEGNSRENGTTSGQSTAMSLVETFAVQLPLTQVGSIPLEVILSDKFDDGLINETVIK